MADTIEMKELQTQIQQGFDALKAAGEKQEAEIKKHGAASQETKGEIAKINAAMDELKKQMDDTQTKLNRTNFAAGGGGQPDPEQEAKSAAFYQFIREGKATLGPDQRKALVEDATGEIIVPEDLDSVLYRELPKTNILRALASVRTTKSNRVRRRSITEVTTGWGKLETSATKTLTQYESTPVPANDWIYVEDAYGLVKIGEDELEDSDINLQALLVDSFGNAYGAMEEMAFVKGTGHAAEQPEGIILAASGVTNFDTATVAAFAVDDLIKVYYEVPAQYRKNGTFIVHTLVEKTARLAKDADGQYLWQPSLVAGAPNMFNGKPIYAQDDLAGAFATGGQVAVFGDFKAGYQIIDRTGSTITRLNELYAEDGLIGFRFKRRVGGGVVRPNAFRILRVK